MPALYESTPSHATLAFLPHAESSWTTAGQKRSRLRIRAQTVSCSANAGCNDAAALVSAAVPLVHAFCFLLAAALVPAAAHFFVSPVAALVVVLADGRADEGDGQAQR